MLLSASALLFGTRVLDVRLLVSVSMVVWDGLLDAEDLVVGIVGRGECLSVVILICVVVTMTGGVGVGDGGGDGGGGVGGVGGASSVNVDGVLVCINVPSNHFPIVIVIV